MVGLRRAKSQKYFRGQKYLEVLPGGVLQGNGQKVGTALSQSNGQDRRLGLLVYHRESANGIAGTLSAICLGLCIVGLLSEVLAGLLLARSQN